MMGDLRYGSLRKKGKNDREQNKALAKVRMMPCIVCKTPGPSDPDHLQTKGAGGKDELTNLIPQCRKHHHERHLIGLKAFVLKYKLPISFDSGYPKRTDL